MTPVFTAEAIEQGLSTARVGRSCIVYDSVESTNDVVKAVMADRQYDGLAVFANDQTNGRGRNGNSWQSTPDSSILSSFLVVFEGSLVDIAGPVNLAAPVAAARAVRTCFPIPASIRWPNDVYVNSGKLGGILIESSQIADNVHAFVIGIGLNVTQKQNELPPRACSVATKWDGCVDQQHRLQLARQLLIELDLTCRQVVDRQYDALRTDWLALSADRDGPVTVEHDGQRLQVRAIDIDYRDNSLLVQNEHGLIWHLQPNVSHLIK